MWDIVFSTTLMNNNAKMFHITVKLLSYLRSTTVKDGDAGQFFSEGPPDQDPYLIRINFIDLNKKKFFLNTAFIFVLNWTVNLPTLYMRDKSSKNQICY